MATEIRKGDFPLEVKVLILEGKVQGLISSEAWVQPDQREVDLFSSGEDEVKFGVRYSKVKDEINGNSREIIYKDLTVY